MTTCAKCGEDRSGGMTPNCINSEACALRAELRDLREAVLAVAGQMQEWTLPENDSIPFDWVVMAVGELREAVGK